MDPALAGSYAAQISEKTSSAALPAAKMGRGAALGVTRHRQNLTERGLFRSKPPDIDVS